MIKEKRQKERKRERERERERKLERRRAEDHESDRIDEAREGDRYCRHIRWLRSIGSQGGRPAIT